MSADWIAEARRLHKAGESTNFISRTLGVSRSSLRRKLNICGEGTKEVERAGVSGYLDKPEPAPSKITLPQFSIPMLPDEDRPRARKAPPPRITVNAGVENIRAIHQRMLREGTFVERGIVEEFRS